MDRLFRHNNRTRHYRACRRAMKIGGVLLILVLLTGCATVTSVDVDTLDFLRQQIQSDRGNTVSATGGGESLTTDLLYDYDELADDDVIKRLQYNGIQPTDTLRQRFAINGKVTLNQATEDVELLFQGFKYGYCLYEHFGGDATFGAAESHIIDSVREVTGRNGTIRIKSLRKIIIGNLGFIQDGHVVFAAQPLLEREHFYFNESQSFSRDEYGFFRSEQGQKLYVVSVSGSSPEEFLKLSLNRNGELTYIIGTMAAGQGVRFYVSVELTDGENSIKTQIPLRRKSQLSFLPGLTYKSETRYGVPVITNRSTAPSTEKMRARLTQFIDEASSLTDYKAAVLDLRNHSGGQWDPALNWTEAFVGTKVEYEQHDAALRSRMSISLHRNFVEWYQRDNEERRISSVASLLRQKADLRNYNPNEDSVWHVRKFQDAQASLLPNDTFLFVLIDRDTCSAGEDFVYFLRQVENVIFVGENTRGQNVTGSPAWGSLPNSGLSFQIPIDMTITGAGADFEGTGFSPDIWVDPARAPVRVLRLISREIEQTDSR